MCLIETKCNGSHLKRLKSYFVQTLKLSRPDASSFLQLSVVRAAEQVWTSRMFISTPSAIQKNASRMRDPETIMPSEERCLLEFQ